MEPRAQTDDGRVSIVQALNRPPQTMDELSAFAQRVFERDWPAEQWQKVRRVTIREDHCLASGYILEQAKDALWVLFGFAHGDQVAFILDPPRGMRNRPLRTSHFAQRRSR